MTPQSSASLGKPWVWVFQEREAYRCLVGLHTTRKMKKVMRKKTDLPYTILPALVMSRYARPSLDVNLSACLCDPNCC
jgi:hypothetical protein